VRKVNTVSVSAMIGYQTPRIICAIHGGNTVKGALKTGAREWRRAAELDEYCREAMKL
jgi:hypothetical protein